MDNRKPLQNGTVLTLHNDQAELTVTISEKIGMGGSCIVYKGTNSILLDRNKEVHQTVIIKEMYPQGLNINRSADNSLDITDHSHFDALKDHFEEGQERHIRFYETFPEHSLPRLFFIGEANNTIYTVSDFGAGQTLDKIDREKLSLDKIASLMDKICSAIWQMFHRYKKLYLDCKPENFFYFFEEDSLEPRVYLFDFDTVISMNDLAEKKFTFCSASLGWAPEEQELITDITGTHGTYRYPQLIGYHTDIYSIAVVFFWLLTNRMPSQEDLVKIQEGTFNWRHESIYCQKTSCEAIDLLQDIVQKSLQTSAQERQNVFRQYISITKARQEYGNLYGLTFGEDVRFKPIHEELSEAKESILKAISNLQAHSLDSSYIISETLATHDETGTSEIQEHFFQEIEKDERLKELYFAAQADFANHPSEITKIRLNNLEKQLENQEKMLSNMRDDMIKGLKLAAQHVSNENIDAREKKALCHIAEGNLKKANTVLRDAQWKAELADIDIILLELKEKSRQYISGQTILISNLVSLGVTDESDKEIRKIYSEIVQLSEKHAVSYEVFYDYAKYLLSQSCYSEGLQIAKRLELLYSLFDCQIEGKNRLNMLIGELCYYIHDYSQALNYYKKVQDSIAGSNPDKNSVIQGIDVLELSQHIAETYWKTNNYIEAQKVLEEIIPYANKIFDENGAVSESADCNSLYTTANIYNLLGCINTAKNCFNEAERYHLTALAIKSVYVDKTVTDHDDALLHLTSTYNNLAFMYKKHKKYDKAKEYYQKAFQIRQKGLETKYTKYARSFAILCTNYAALLGKTKQTEDARKMMLNYVFPIKQDYYNRYPDDYGEFLAYSYDDYGLILSESDNASYYEEASHYFLLAIQLKEQMKKNGRLTSEKTIAISYQHYANFLKMQGNNESQLYYSKALEIFHALEDQNPGYFTSFIKDINASMGSLDTIINNITDM